MQQGYFLSPDLFKAWGQVILRELHDLPGFLSVDMILTYAGDTLLMTNSEDKENDPFDNLMVEDKNKGLTIKCRKQNCQKKKTSSPS